MTTRSKPSTRRALPVVVASLAFATACTPSASDRPRAHPPPPARQTVATATATSALAPAPAPPRFVPAPSELDAVEPFIQEQVERSLGTNTRTLVYVGAPWCEPCQRFHAAVLHGELDTLLSGTQLLEFDADHHGAALHRAGYAFKLIPVIAIPDADGRSSGRLLSGSIKGPTAVTGDLVPRLHALLAGGEVD